MPRPWMPFYVADYLADTGHLSTVEHGAYFLLIMHYWQHGELPDDDRKLARISRLTHEEWNDVRETLAEFFDSEWRHKRIDEELAKAEEIISKRVAAGKAGARARYGKGSSKGNGKRIANANDVPSQTHSHPPSPTPYSVSNETAPVDPKEWIWDEGIKWLSDRTGKPVGSLRSMVGALCRDYGNEQVQETLVDAMAMDVPPVEPVAWIKAAMKPKQRDGPKDHSSW